jgi:hypothetical protein
MSRHNGIFVISLHLPSQEASCFHWGNERWCYTRLPFGIKNSSAILQQVMDGLLQEGGLDGVSAPFVDDVIVWSEMAADHIRDVQWVLQCLGQAGLRFHPDKSIFIKIDLSGWLNGWLVVSGWLMSCVD